MPISTDASPVLDPLGHVLGVLRDAWPFWLRWLLRRALPLDFAGATVMKTDWTSL